MSLPSHAELDEARRIGDPAADAIVAALGRDVWIVNSALRHVHCNGDPLPDGVPPIVRRFFAEEVALPQWLDEARVRRAQRWASRHLFHVTVALFCASLPTAYAAARGARVLVATGEMHGANLDRRINETAQFVLDVVAEGGFDERGSAIRAIQKVRLVHAAVRARLLARGFGDDGEVPINQEDMLGTLITFSAVVLRASRRLGLSIDDDEAEDYYHLWRAVGAMLGIRDDLVPRDLASAYDVGERIAARHFEASEHGRALMATLLAGMESHVPQFPSAPRHLVRYLVGERMAEQLGLPEDAGFHAKLTFARLLPRASSRSIAALARHLSPLLGRPLLQTVIAAKLEGRAPTFSMPS